MKTQELMKALNSGVIIYTAAHEFLNSSIMWFEDNINPLDYIPTKNIVFTGMVNWFIFAIPKRNQIQYD